MIKVDVSQESINNIVKKLGDMHAKIPIVLRKSINDATKQIRNQIARKVKQRYVYEKYNAKIKDVKDLMKIEKATVSNLSASIKATGELNEIKEFKVSSLTPNARVSYISAKVLKKSGMTPLVSGKVKAFAMKFKKSGHVSVVTRIPTIRGRNGRDKIRKLMSPSVAHMVKKTYEEEINGAQILQESLNKTVAKLLSK